MPPRRNLFIVLLGVFAVGLTLQLVRTGSPDLAVSCDEVGFAMSTEEVALGDPVQWTLTGPRGSAYFLALGVASFTRQPDGTFRSVPDSGRVREQTQQLSEDIEVGDDCRDTGVFAVLPPVKTGPHSVAVFRRTPERIERVSTRPLRIVAE